LPKNSAKLFSAAFALFLEKNMAKIIQNTASTLVKLMVKNMIKLDELLDIGFNF
jgi:hypothetical protein